MCMLLYNYIDSCLCLLTITIQLRSIVELFALCGDQSTWRWGVRRTHSLCSAGPSPSRKIYMFIDLDIKYICSLTLVANRVTC